MMTLLMALVLAQDVESFECDSTDRWALLEAKGARLAAEKGAVVLSYDRGTVTPLAHAALLTEFEEIRLTLTSSVDTTFVLTMEDRDGAIFNTTIKAKSGRAATHRVKAGDLKLADDSKVKKAALDVKRLGAGYALFDAGAIFGASGAGRLEIDRVEVARQSLKVEKGDLVVEKDTEIRESVVRDGHILVRNGAKLRITAPRFTLRGNLGAEKSKVEIDGCVFALAQRFNHEFGMPMTQGSALSIRRSLVFSGTPFGVDLPDGGALDVADAEFFGGMTVDVPAKAQVSLRGVKTPGEFVISPGSRVSIEDTHFAILWFEFGPNAEGTISMPPGEKVDDFTMGHGHDVRVRNATSVLFCLVSKAGSAAIVEKSTIYATGIFFDGKAKASFRGLHNKKALDDVPVTADDRKLRFVKSTVQAWNFYAAEEAEIQVDDCTFGEVLTFHQGKVDIRSSRCDGTGGYVGSDQGSQLTLTKCKIECLVVAKETSTLTLVDCEVTGDVRAVGKATVRLVRTQVAGKVEADPDAKIVRE